ncbi:MAG: DnaJ domain-containing protein [Armatimonadia bacterium]|nr:DnaJ domain-containing protein [Armatimonadia bacterium]
MRPAHLVLGVSADAPQKEVRRAYRRLAKELHPDRAAPADRAEAHARFLELRAAYETLVGGAQPTISEAPREPAVWHPPTRRSSASQPRPGVPPEPVAAAHSRPSWATVLVVLALSVVLGCAAYVVARQVTPPAAPRAPEVRASTVDELAAGAAGTATTLATGDADRGMDAYEAVRSRAPRPGPSLQYALDLYRMTPEAFVRTHGGSVADVAGLRARCDAAGQRALRAAGLSASPEALRNEIQPTASYPPPAGAWSESTSVYLHGFATELGRRSSSGPDAGHTQP